MTMDRRNLGTTGMEITTVGFGSWAVGGGGWSMGWGPQDDEESIAAILAAVAGGVNWIDTASIYGLGHSEEVVGRAIRRIPASERPLVFTKCGLAWDPANPLKMAVRTSEPAALRETLEASLRRLGVDTIDLMQIHRPDEQGTSAEDAWGQMSRFVEEGKVRAIGVSNFTIDQLDRYERVRHIDTIQPLFSAIDRQSAAGLIPWAAAHGTGVIVYSPMGSGILTDSFSRSRIEAMAADDWRSRAPRFQEPALGANLAFRDALRPIAARHGVKVEALAVAWALAWPGVSGAIVGARNAAQPAGWLPAGNLRLSAGDLAEIGAALEATGAGEGPISPAAPTTAGA
jgi:aryl-alcohol dehydrogenase-like predicted oxidoreductase